MDIKEFVRRVTDGGNQYEFVRIRDDEEEKQFRKAVDKEEHATDKDKR